MIKIGSLDDPRVAVFRNVRDADLRGGGGRAPLGTPSKKLFMAESEPVIRRLIASKRYPIRAMLLSHEKFDAMRDVLSALEGEQAVYVAEESLLREISGYRHHGGALAAGVRPDERTISFDALRDQIRSRERLTLVLCERITHVDNIGAIFRNAAAFDVDGIILDGACADPLFRKATRVSMGHVFHVPWAVSQIETGGARAHSLVHVIRRLRDEWGVVTLAAESGARPSGGHVIPVAQIDWPNRVAVAVGSERHGLSIETLAEAEAIIEISLSPGVPSLNVATATAVLLHERLRTLFRPSRRPSVVIQET